MVNGQNYIFYFESDITEVFPFRTTCSSYDSGDKFWKYDFRTSGEGYIYNSLSWLIQVIRKGCFHNVMCLRSKGYHNISWSSAQLTFAHDDVSKAIVYFTNPDFQKIHCYLFKRKWRIMSQKRKEQNSSEIVKIWRHLFHNGPLFSHNGPVLMPHKSCNALPGDL